jgi:alkylation response protein AidB-like acyl-CoA dehydrogenase
MDFTLTEKQKQLMEIVRDLCKKHVDQKEIGELVSKAAVMQTLEEIRAIQPLGLIKKIHELGLRQLSVPTEYGGHGLAVGENLTRVLLAEEIGYLGGHFAARLLTKDWQTCSVIAGPNTTREQKDWFFPKFMENPVGICAHAVSEPQGSTDIHMPWDAPGVALKTFAQKDGNDWIINGHKMFSHGGGVADYIWLVARTDRDGPVSTSASVFWILKDTPGVTFHLNRMILPEITGNFQTYFNNVRIPGSQLVGQVNKGMGLLEDLLGTKLLAFSSIIGYARHLYEDLVAYAKQRVQGGKPIIRHSDTAAMLGEVAIQLEAARSMQYRAAWEIDQREKTGAPRNNFWSISNFYLVKRLCLLLAEMGSNIYGGIAGTVDLPFSHWVQHTYVFLAGGGGMSMDKIESSKWYNDHTLGEPWKKAE